MLTSSDKRWNKFRVYRDNRGLWFLEKDIGIIGWSFNPREVFAALHDYLSGAQ